MPPSAFPNTATVGQKYTKYRKHDPDWKAITIESIFEDQGADRNQSTTTPTYRWTFQFRGLTETQAKVLDDHLDSCGGTYLGFSFTEPRDYPWSGTTGSVFTDVHYESYERDHDPKLWTQIRTITLVKRPS